MIDLNMTVDIPYDRNVYMDLLSHTYNGIHNEYDSFEAMDSNVNRREKAEYELIYKEANDLASKLDGFIGDRSMLALFNLSFNRTTEMGYFNLFTNS